MISFIIRRLLGMIPTLVLVSILTFIIIQLPPGDFMTTLQALAAASGSGADQASMDTLIALGSGVAWTFAVVEWLNGVHHLSFETASALVAFLLAALLVGGDQLQSTMQLPSSTALILQGAILFCMVGGDLFTKYQLRWRRTPAAVSAAPARETN